MNEHDFKGILAEISDEEIAALNEFAPFKPSLRHRRVMRRLFSKCRRKKHYSSDAPDLCPVSQNSHLRLSTRLIILLTAIACTVLLTGAVIVYFSKSFHGTVYSDNTHIFTVNAESCPTTIEYKYYLPELPDGFEMSEHDSSQFDVYTRYKNSSSNQGISFDQYVKDGFEAHYNTENHTFEEIKINDTTVLYIDFSTNTKNSSVLIWDNDDYIIEILADLDKNSAMNLLNITKL